MAVKFKLPEEMPTGAEDLEKLRSKAAAEVARLNGVLSESGTLSDADVEYLELLVDAIKKIEASQNKAKEAAEARNNKITKLLDSVTPDDVVEETDEDVVDEDDESDVDEDDEDETDESGDVVSEAEQIIEDESSVTAGAKRPVSFKGMGKGKTPDVRRRTNGERDYGFTMDPQAPGYKPGFVGFEALAEGLDSVRPGVRTRSNRPTTGAYAGLTLGRLARGVKMIDDPHELYAEINRATALDQYRMPKFSAQGGLTAAGGWCAPSETLYDFCETPTAADLMSLPEIAIRRGGVRWPDEPDLSAIFEDFEWFFTEAQLEAVDGNGDPTAIKTCVEIPCPETFTEIRLNAVGYCVEAGILQTQGWPELIAKFMAELTQEHFRALSRRTIADMVTGSTAITMPAENYFGVASAVLNAMALNAMNLRLDRGLARTAMIEAVAPSFLLEAMRADLAMRDGVDALNISDAQLMGLFTARNISLMLVGDWQTRSAGLPGNITTLEWPSTVNVLMYPAGTWFRSMSNVIELGVMYPKELLQVNRYTRMFTEDAIVVAKRCGKSLNVQIPICPSGAIGERQSVLCNSATVVNEVQRIAVATGTITAGTFTLTFNGQTTGTIAWNASAAAVKTALDALSNLETADTTTAGGALPGTPVDVTFTGAYQGVNVPQLTVNSASLTGGTLAVTTTTQGHS
jgi:hypothetical protein